MSADGGRRDFLKWTAATAAWYWLGGDMRLQAETTVKSRVVLFRHPRVTDVNQTVNREILSGMLDEGMLALTGAESVSAAWQSILQPDDILGIKTNVWRYLPTPPELNELVAERAKQVGIPGKNIGIRDRGCYRDELFQKATALINMRPMRTHFWSGVGSLIKNCITFVPRPSDWHADVCADLGKLWLNTGIHGKVRLNILVMLTPLFHGTGPHHFNPDYVWRYNGLVMGFDPVAVDATGVRILQAKRNAHFKEPRPLNPPPKHIFLADTRHHLGTADPKKIELVKLGWTDDILI